MDKLKGLQGPENLSFDFISQEKKMQDREIIEPIDHEKLEDVVNQMLAKEGKSNSATVSKLFLSRAAHYYNSQYGNLDNFSETPKFLDKINSAVVEILKNKNIGVYNVHKSSKFYSEKDAEERVKKYKESRPDFYE